MEKILIFIKHHFAFLWRMIEWGNGLLFSLLFRSKLEAILPAQFQDADRSAFSFRRLTSTDAEELHKLIHSQDPADLKYFSPHAFDLRSISKQFKNRSFLMMGAFNGEAMVGYFFLRFFANKKCFVGRIIDKDSRGKGIGNEMNRIMYGTAWSIGFHCLSTMSKDNRAVMQAHSRNATMRVLKELKNNYILVEFVNPESSK